ncbi:MAG: hypothetical protein KDB26_00840 [Microthrixaceae bacterium]|nr:hypothetical protein [Microthrixaceae bacterium]
MEQVGIRDLRQSITAMVRSAGAGNKVQITIDGHPVAQLGPIENDEPTASLQDLADRGELVLAPDPARPKAAAKVELWHGARIDHLIREVRGR